MRPPVKESTVDRNVERIRKERPDMSVSQARKIAVESAERVNRQRREGK